MPDYQDRMKDYVPVNERIDAFVTAFPEGCLQSEIVELTDSRVTVKAYAYRTPTDPRPGTGHSSLNIPGSTPYTKGSEIENAETSAWGRAIAALGFEVKRGAASAEEVANKERETSAPPIAALVARVRERAEEHGLGYEQWVALLAKDYPGKRLGDLTRDELIALGTAITRGQYDRPIEQPGVPVDVDSTPAPSPEQPPADPLQAVLDATGGTEVVIPPEPGTDAYKALTPGERANAKAYWATQPSGELAALA